MKKKATVDRVSVHDSRPVHHIKTRVASELLSSYRKIRQKRAICNQVKRVSAWTNELCFFYYSKIHPPAVFE